MDINTTTTKKNRHKESEICTDVFALGSNQPSYDEKLVQEDRESERIYYLTDAINEESMNLVYSIMRWNREDKDLTTEQRKPIKVIIDSPGGDVSSMNAIVSAFKLSKTPIITIVSGAAFSAAAVILAHGHKRYAFPRAHSMFHSGFTSLSGTNQQVESARAFLTEMEKRTDKELYEVVKFPKKILKQVKTDDVYLNDAEMLEYGVIDGILTDFDFNFDALYSDGSIQTSFELE